MTITRSASVAVVLVGLPGIYEGMLKQQLASDPGLRVFRLTDQPGSDGLPDDMSSVVVVRAAPAALRRAATLVAGNARVLGTVAVTDDDPRGDAYLVSPAGINVSHDELARLIRDVAAQSLQPRFGMPNPTRAVTRSDS